MSEPKTALWKCILCAKSYDGVPAERPRNGPVCKPCVAEDTALAAKLRKKRKKKRRKA